MKKILTSVAALAVCALVASPSFAANNVRISQVYGGGGASTGSPTYTRDYVELFNSSAAAVNIGGWTLEYGSATGNWGSSASNIFTFPANTLIQPCSYVLVAMTAGTAGGALPVTPDFSSTLTMSGTSGKVGLFNAVNTNLACGSELPGTLVDKVAYGTANCSEVTAVGVLSTTTGAVRNTGGIDDTDNNLNDFTVVTAPVPRNSASPQNALCLPVPAQPSTWSNIKSIYR